MTKPRITISIIITALFLLSGAQVWASGFHAKRYYQQQQRILHGMMGGDLTRGEYARLQREQRRLLHAEMRAWSDRRLTWRERERLLRMRDRASRHIYRARHNRAIRVPRRPIRIVERPRLHRPYVISHYDSWGPQFHFGGLIGDPGFSFGWSINVP